MEMLILFFSSLAPAHTAKGTKSWFNDHGVTVLDWPAISLENLLDIVKRKMRDTRPNNADYLKAAIKAACASLHLSSAVPQATCLHATPH